jgi:hypothetical protein
MTATSQPTFVTGEVGWKSTSTYNIFSALWNSGAKPVAGRRSDISGMKYQRVLLPTDGIKKVVQRLKKVDTHSKVYLTE